MIESFHKVVCDNKVLRLAFNEQILLTTCMELIFVISHLNQATSTIVSKADISHNNETDIGSTTEEYLWIDKQNNASE